MPDADRRPGLWTFWLLVGGLLLTTCAVGVLVRVECPRCKGGRQIQMSMGPMPCEECAELKRVTLWQRAAYGVMGYFR